MKLIIPDWHAPDKVSAFSSLREGGVSTPPYHGRNASDGGLNLAMHVQDNPEAVRQNRALLGQYLPSEPIWLNQVHSNKVVCAEEVDSLPDADACVSHTRNKVCVVMTADCLPVLLCDAEGAVVAAAHAGWRGLANGILENTIMQMQQAGAKDILAWLGPAIGPTVFEVGEDVREAFSKQGLSLNEMFNPLEDKPGKYLLNIYGVARALLEKMGVKKVSGGNFCTMSDLESFYSYRRDGVTGRMVSCIWLK